jgi:hypothetical protein
MQEYDFMLMKNCTTFVYMKKTTNNFLFLCLIFSISNSIAVSQNVYIPNITFKNYLLNNPAINTNADSEIQITEATAFSDTINCSDMHITDLTGIEAFTSLTYLNCSSNDLTSLNVSSNTALLVLYCFYNLLTDLNVNTNTSLEELVCDNNLLTSLDVSANTSLNILRCSNNELTSLDVSGNTALTLLRCSNNQIGSLDISNNSNLFQLHCHINQLTSLNAKNGHNTSLLVFFATYNPDLTCIQVDNAAWSDTNWLGVDSMVVFSENCNTGLAEENNQPHTISIYPNPASNFITLETQTTKGIYQLQDITGKILLDGNVNAAMFNLDISALSKGVYFLSLQTNDGLLIKKIEVVK